MKRSVVVLLVAALILFAAIPSMAAVPGKSAIEVGTFFVSGGTDYVGQINYRATDSLSFGAAIEPFSGTVSGFSFSGTATSLWAHYYFAPSEKADPYLLAQFNTANVTVSGFGSASASATILGVGTTYRVNDFVRLRGAVGFVNGRTSYNVGATYDFSERTYGAIGLAGGSGTSNLYLGIGTRF